MDPRTAVLVEVGWSLAATLAQCGLLWWGMICVTASDVPGNTFRNTWPLWAATLPLFGWLVARRRHGVVRRQAMRLHALTCALFVLDLVIPSAGG